MPHHSIPTPLFAVYLAFAVWLFGAAGAALQGKRTSHPLGASLMGAGGLLVVWGAVFGLHESAVWQAPYPIFFGVAPLANSLDSLSAVFLLILGVVATACALYSPAYLDHLKDRVNPGLYWACVFMLLISMAEVVLSANAMTFMIFWELMSLSSVALVASDQSNNRAPKAALIYMGATRAATALLAGGFLWMHSLSGSWEFARWSLVDTRFLPPSLLIFLGLAIKAGVWPFHLWLPYAYPAAPTPVAALMSGVVSKVAIYALVRLLVYGGIGNELFAYAVLFLGTVSAFWGVLFALAQKDLKKLLAFSSIENIGLITMGVAVSLLSRVYHLPDLAALALAAALLHCVNDSMFKSLLFLGSGAVHVGAGTRNLEQLGGIVKKMPWTSVFFLIGSASICSLPPFNGFVSKWLLYQALLLLAGDSQSLVVRAIALACVGVLALVGGLALACFTRAVGIGFLGRARMHAVERSREVPSGMLCAQGALACLCLLFGMAAPLVLTLLQPACATAAGAPVNIAGSFTIPLPVLAALLAGGGLVAYVLFLRGRHAGVREYITWECGYGDLPVRTEETASSFAEPIEHIFGSILGYRIDLVITGKDRRHFPERVKEETRQESLLESRVYGPLIEAIDWLSKRFTRIQTGSIHLYLLYMLLTLVLLMTVGTQL